MFDRKKEDPLRKAVMKIFDPNIDSPDVFFKMKEVDGVQYMRKYDKSSGEVRYAGTYEILFKTEDLSRFCMIMTRAANEWPVPEDLEPLADEMDAWIVCEYRPGTHGRINVYGLPEEAVTRITEKFEKKRRRKGLFR